MSLIDDLTALGDTSDVAMRGKVWPDGWQPRSEVDDETGGYIVSEPYTDTPPDHSALFELHGLDPTKWVITRARSSRWQQRSRGTEPVWLEASRIEFEPVAAVRRAHVDAEALIARIGSWRPRKPKSTTRRVLVAPVGDTQIGKIEGGGTPATVDRFLDQLEGVVARQRQLKAGTVWLPWLGDCIEGTVSQGGKVRGRLDLTITEQVRVYRRLVMAQIKGFAPLADELVIVGIPGNHDEPTRDVFTVGTDSWALDAISAVADGVAENPELDGRVRFLYPDHDQLTVTADIEQVRVTMTHGHQFGTTQDYWQKWWGNQTAARLLPGDADVLLAAHRHHLRVADFAGGRMFIQIPAMDGGSQHFDDRQGGNVPPRLVSFVLEDGRVRHLDPVL